MKNLQTRHSKYHLSFKKLRSILNTELINPKSIEINSEINDNKNELKEKNKLPCCEKSD